MMEMDMVDVDISIYGGHQHGGHQHGGHQHGGHRHGGHQHGGQSKSFVVQIISSHHFNQMSQRTLC